MKWDVKNILMTFVLVVLGVALIGQLADAQYGATNPFGVTNETFDISAYRNGANTTINESYQATLANDDWVASGISAILYENGSALETSLYTIDYTNELINLTNASVLLDYPSNNTYVTYQFYPETYVHHSTSRVLIGFLTLFFVIGLLLFVIVKIFGWESIKEMLKL